MSSTSTKRSTTVEDLMKDAEALNTRARTSNVAKEEVKPDAVTEKFANVQANTFYKIMFGEGSPEEKQKQLAQALTYDSTMSKQENKARLEEFALFKEYVHFERKRMAQEIIKLTDTETFGELKDVFEQMNTALLDFEGEISPLMEILDAVYEINKQGGDAVYDVFKQIEEDKKREKELAEQRTAQEAELRRAEEEIRNIRLRNAELAEKKSFFGFGGTTADAKAEIARNEALLAEKNTTLSDLGTRIKETTEAQKTVAGSSEFAAQKEQIRKLLDISSEEHKARSEKLVGKANAYIDTTYERTTSVLEGLRRLSGQIDNLGDANSGMHQVFAIVSDGMKDAEKANEVLRDTLQKVEGEETAIAKMQREQKKLEVEEYIGLTLQQSADNVQAINSLTNESLQIKSLRDTNNQQIGATQTLSSSGVSGIASQLATVLQGVSAASLDQSRETSALNIDKMNRINEGYLKKSVMQSAMGVYKQNDELVKTIDRLRETGEFIRNVNGAVSTGVKELRENLNTMEEVAKSMKKDVDDSVAISADTIRDDLNGAAAGKQTPANDSARTEEKKAAPSSPFGNFGPR
ncbi:MAG: hypothetical protein KJ667_00210 [Alphaproteobacteria bacterium]|nr:hypothetical protein [Alphaproteobacteria bacterium]